MKIHEAATHEGPPPTDRNNQPHVCTFHVHGFGFDAADTGAWRIYGWQPTGERTMVRTEAWAGTEWRSDVMTLPDGHYRLVVDITGDANDTRDDDTTADKHKMFWVECGPPASAGGAGGAGAGGQAKGDAEGAGGVGNVEGGAGDAGGGQPSGQVLGIGGTAGGADVTPPPTDAVAAVVDERPFTGTLVILLAILGVVAAAVLALSPRFGRLR